MAIISLQWLILLPNQTLETLSSNWTYPAHLSRLQNLINKQMVTFKPLQILTHKISIQVVQLTPVKTGLNQPILSWIVMKKNKIVKWLLKVQDSKMLVVLNLFLILIRWLHKTLITLQIMQIILFKYYRQSNKIEISRPFQNNQTRSR